MTSTVPTLRANRRYKATARKPELVVVRPRGPFSAEGPTIARLHEFIATEVYRFDGRHQKHHEICLSDIRRAAPDKWLTILRQPIQPAE